MPPFTRKEYKHLEALLREGHLATSIAKLLIPETYLNHKLYCGGSFDSCRKHPLALVAKPGTYSLHMSPSKMRLRIHLTAQPILTSRYKTVADAAEKDDPAKLSKARESLFDNFLGEQSGFLIGGNGMTCALVVLARPGSYYCERVEDDIWIWMEVRDEDNLVGALYSPGNSSAAPPPRSVSSGSGKSLCETVYSGGLGARKSSSASGGNVPKGFFKAKGWWSFEEAGADPAPADS